jgi:hypothetical protein
MNRGAITMCTWFPNSVCSAIVWAVVTAPPVECPSNPAQGPCHEPADFGVPGCEDPECCALVCEQFAAYCCENWWSPDCAQAAVDLGCAVSPAGPVCLATGDDPDVDGYLEVCADAYGSVATEGFGGKGDRFNPQGGDLAEVTFAGGMYLFRAEALQRELLSHAWDWQSKYQSDYSLEREVLKPIVAVDTDGDAVADTAQGVFRVFGAELDLTFHLDQSVEPRGAGVSLWSMDYEVQNNGASPVEFVLLRVLDADLAWSGAGDDDVVGTQTNGSPLERFVYMHDGAPQTGVTVSSPHALPPPDDGAYYGAKEGPDPDGSGSGPQFISGLEWYEYGVPEGWRNVIAGVPGSNVNGESGTEPGDAWIGLEIPVALAAGPGPGSGATVTVRHTYGALTPLGLGPCPWDCDGSGDGQVNVVDFLALLAQWGGPGSCDVDAGGVGVTDFLAMLANWGACP